MKKLLILPKYSEMAPSSRYRIFNYLPYYKATGLQYEAIPLFGDWYLKNLWQKKSKLLILHKILGSYLKRFIKLLFVKRNTIVYIGAELFPFLPFGIERYLKFRGIPYIIEFDDAIFHNYDIRANRIKRLLFQHKTEKVIRNASCVIGGCQYLCDYAKQWNNNVIEIPTSIDANKYNVQPIASAPPVIGWIGSPLSSKFLEIVLEPLRRLSKEFNFTLNLIGCDKDLSQRLQGINYNIIPWSNETEISEMQKFTVGIMPLEDTPFARGKCAFKLVQYMAMGLPTVSTPLQSNVNISRGNSNLFAETSDEWYDALKKVLTNPQFYKKVGDKNKILALKEYTFQENWKKYMSIFNQL